MPLNAEEFLNRVIPLNGPHIAFAIKGPASMSHRFWPRDEVSAAADWMRHTARSTDVYIAVAAYTEPRRRQAKNAHSIQCFFVDADIKREGDGKDPGKAYADLNELVAWVKHLRDGFGMPFPNLWINSGYGMHLYWVLDQPMGAEFWMPQADALKALLVASGAKGDIGISGDVARILRAPQSFNHKVAGSPAACLDVTPAQSRLPDAYPINDIIQVLHPYYGSKRPGLGAGLGAQQNPGSAQQRATSRNSTLVNAAKAGLERAPRDIAIIAENCRQVRTTLEEHGANDGRPLWHLMVNLAYACKQPEMAHRLGDAHPKYTEEETNAKLEQTDQEHQDKDFGAPFCRTFNAARPGICEDCPHWQKIDSPYSLGIKVDTAGLPTGYRRHEGWIEQEVEGKDGGQFWIKLVMGDVGEPHLVKLPEGGYRLEFDYTRAGHTSRVAFDEKQLSSRIDTTTQLFAPQGVSLNRDNALAWGDFMRSWIEHLRDSIKVEDAPPSFGWLPDDKDGYEGLSVGGTFYAADGTTKPALVGDPKIHAAYIPRGTVEGWSEVARFVLDGRPELQVIAAAAFGAPIMEFTGVSGCLNIWSRESGARKTSAFMTGAAVWCNPRTGMSSLRDTTNAVQHSLSETKFMPVYWDEIQTASKENLAAMIENFFNITQGRGRARLDSNIRAREVGQWRTLFLTSSNIPIAELISHARAATDAGNVRVFEYRVEPKGKALAHAGTVVQNTERHYGQAGRMYAAWIAQKWQQVRDLVVATMRDIEEKVGGIEASERFYVSAVAATITGARIARHLQLYQFDVDAIAQFLIAEFMRQRNERQSYYPKSEEEDFTQQFNRFCADHTDAILVVQTYPKSGNQAQRRLLNAGVIIKHLQPNINIKHALIYIGLEDAELRFEHQALQEWCRRVGNPFRPLLEYVIKNWGFTGEEKRHNIIAKGTPYASGGNVTYYRLSLRRPELAHYLTVWGSASPPSGDNVVPLRPSPP